MNLWKQIKIIWTKFGVPWKLLEDYLRCRLKLEEIYEIKANGVKISSKYNLYDYAKSVFKPSEKLFHSESNS